MDNENAERSVDVALQSPEKFLTFEFQGGEPLLNYKVIKHIVEYTEERKQGHHISYNVVSNLTLLTDEMIEFFSKYDFGISTSVDGPENVHNCNRTFANGTGSYEKVVCKIEKIREAGLNIGAIQTTTKESLNYSKEIVMTYKELGFRSIFIRPLTPLGKATVNWNEIGYTAEEFMDFYKRVMEEVLRLNKQGYYMSEGHSSILLNKMKGKFVNYMELRSPCGGGIGQLAYYADGNVFTCDEGRMLYEMGQNTFCLGNVKKNNFNEIVNNGVCRTVCKASILEALPSCCDCVYQPYCGTCPVVNYALDKDIIEKKPRGYRCKIYSGMLDFLFEKIYNGEQDTINILNSWGE
jgi:His-Xaa-Ser system radical SAM maturase HxsB